MFGLLSVSPFWGTKLARTQRSCLQARRSRTESLARTIARAAPLFWRGTEKGAVKQAAQKLGRGGAEDLERIGAGLALLLSGQYIRKIGTTHVTKNSYTQVFCASPHSAESSLLKSPIRRKSKGRKARDKRSFRPFQSPSKTDTMLSWNYSARTVFNTISAGANPSAVAVSLIAPAWSCDSTMT